MARGKRGLPLAGAWAWKDERVIVVAWQRGVSQDKGLSQDKAGTA